MVQNIGAEPRRAPAIPGPGPRCGVGLTARLPPCARAERVLERNERIELLVDKTDALSEQSLMFERQVRGSGPWGEAGGRRRQRWAGSGLTECAPCAVAATAAQHVVEERQDDGADRAPGGRRHLRHCGHRVRRVQLPQLQELVGRTRILPRSPSPSRGRLGPHPGAPLPAQRLQQRGLDSSLQQAASRKVTCPSSMLAATVPQAGAARAALCRQLAASAARAPVWGTRGAAAAPCGPPGARTMLRPSSSISEPCRAASEEETGHPRSLQAAALAASSGADVWAQLGTIWSQYVATTADALLTVQTATHLPWWAAIAVRAPGSHRLRPGPHACVPDQGVTVVVRSVQLPFVLKSLRTSERCAASACA